MQYRELIKNGDKLSVLGQGCMRFPKKNGFVDEKKVEEIFIHGYKNGINYYDTAYFYENGKSEVILGNFIKKHNIREKVFIADKMPPFIVKNRKQIEKLFATQLERLQTDYIDYYLMHMLDSLAQWQSYKNMGMLDFLLEMKEKGAIRYIGFSFHGSHTEFIKIIDDFSWDFCQVQFNYLDEYNQAGIKGIEYAKSKGIGISVMEPLRGGSLASNVPTEVKKVFASYGQNHAPAYWGLRFVMNNPAVSVVLSGMNELSQIDENIRVSNDTTANSMSNDELNIINQVKEIFRRLMKVPCTGCMYCMPCPFGVDIPRAFSDYNNKYFSEKPLSTLLYLYRSVGGSSGKKSSADMCTSCGICVKKCPQSIDIPFELKNAHKALNNEFIKFFLKIIIKLRIKK